MRTRLIFKSEFNLILVLLSILFCSCSRFSTPEGAKLQVSSSSTTLYSGEYKQRSTNWFIQKEGEKSKVLNGRNLMAAVNDNPSALSHAKVYKAMRASSMVLFLTFFAGVTYGILGRESNPNLAKSVATVGLLSIPAFMITAPIGTHHAKKSIKIYNGF